MKAIVTIIILLPGGANVMQAKAQLPGRPDTIHVRSVNSDTAKPAKQLAAVAVTAYSLKSLEQSTRAVTIIDAKKYYNRPATAIGLINQSPGVRVRQDGGLGSKADFSINGISGRQVKFFI